MARMTDREYIEQQRRNGAVSEASVMILEGAIDAPHHRQWYLDQALRLLAGDDYDDLIKAFEGASGEDWDTGVAP